MADPASLPPEIAAVIPPPRTRCMCGARKTVCVTIEFLLNGRIEHGGGRFCYEHWVDVTVPLLPGAVLTEVRIWGWHVPDEQIRVMLTQEDSHAV